MHADLADVVRDVPNLTARWDFSSSEGGVWLALRRIAAASLRRRPPPAFSVLKPLRASDHWIVWFVFAPQGRLTDGHRFTLSRLRDMGRPLFVVCAAPAASAIPAWLIDGADALYWKALSGYDFSGYSLALNAVSAHSPHATVLVLNDSVYGPFHDLRPFMDRSPWDLTGFSASSLHENHVQSYAFVLRDVCESTLECLAPVFPRAWAYDRAADVILCQELTMARVASRGMRVGSCWYGIHEQIADPTLVKPLELLGAGFPFMKRSVFGKHAGFQAHAREALTERLIGAGHPRPQMA